MCIVPLGENGLEKYRLSRKWDQFKIVLLFMDHPVGRSPRMELQLAHHTVFGLQSPHRRPYLQKTMDEGVSVSYCHPYLIGTVAFSECKGLMRTRSDSSDSQWAAFRPYPVS